MFNVGDRVKRVRGGYCGCSKEGDIGTVISMRKSGYFDVRLDEDGSTDEYYMGNYELVEKAIIKNNFMTTLIQKYKELTAKEPEKTFIKAGVMDSNFNVTTEGRQLFEAFIFEKFADDFKTEVVDKLVEEKK